MDAKELKQFESVYQPSKEITFCWGVKKYVQLCLEQDYTEIVDHANDSLRIWQAAKTQAEINEINFNIDQLVAENLYFRDKKWDENSAYTEGQTNMYLVKQAEIDELQKRINEALTYLRHIDSRGYGESVLSKILKGKQND